MTNTTTTAPRAIYAGVGWRETPQTTLADMTRMAHWLHRTGWHPNTGGAPGPDQAFVDGTPPGTRTRYLPWAGYNGHTGPDCHPLSGDERPPPEEHPFERRQPASVTDADWRADPRMRGDQRASACPRSASACSIRSRVSSSAPRLSSTSARAAAPAALRCSGCSM